MNSTRSFALAVAFTTLVAPLAQAAVSPEDAAATCKAEAQTRFSQGDELARVKFKGMFGSATLRKVRIQVLPPAGGAFLAVCEINGRGGEFVSLTRSDQKAGAGDQAAR